MLDSTKLALRAIITTKLYEALAAAGYPPQPTVHPSIQSFIDNVTDAVHTAPPAQCRGVTDSVCNYLSHCKGICNKCGKQHDGQINRSAPWA